MTALAAASLLAAPAHAQGGPPPGSVPSGWQFDRMDNGLQSAHTGNVSGNTNPATAQDAAPSGASAAGTARAWFKWNGTGTPTPLSVLLNASASGNPMPGVSSVSVDDGLGDLPAANWPPGLPGPTFVSSSGKHLQQSSGTGTEASFPVTLSATGNGFANVVVNLTASLDTRMVTISPLGHIGTFRKSVNTDGTIVPFPNTASGDTLEVDTWLGLNFDNSNPNATNPDLYTITYQAGAAPSESVGDNYDFQEGMKSLSETGTITSGGFQDVVPTITAGYDAPYVYYDPLPWPQDGYDQDHPHLHIGDAAGLDQIDLTYKYLSDSAVADYYLLVNFHLPYEKWTQIGNLQGDENMNTSYVSVPISPSPAQGGQNATANPLSIMNQIAFGGVSAGFTGIGALMGEDPHVAAFMAVTGYLVDKITPVNSSATSDGIQNFAAAIARTQASLSTPDLSWESLCSNPQWMIAQANDNAADMTVADAQCTWTLLAQTPIWIFHYQGDHYGAFGFLGEVPTDITQAGQPAWFHYYTYAPPQPPQSPIQPS